MPREMEQMIAQDAALKRLELFLGLISKDGVIAWADEIVAGVDDPPFQLFDISLAGNKSAKEVASLLRELGEDADIEGVSATAFRRFAIARYKELEAGSVSSDEVAASLYKVAWQTDLILPMEYAEFCNWVDDEFALVRQGIKERPPAEMALNDFFRSIIDDEEA